MIYLYENPGAAPEALIRETLPLMPPERRKKALRYRFAADRNMCVIAYWLLMQGLEREYGIKKPPTFLYGENGKPALAEHPGIHFNVSHCRAGVACAVCDDEVGIDIEETQPFGIAVARRVFTPGELALLAQSGEPDSLFCRLWARKEAYLKRHGLGISDELNRLELPDDGFHFAELANAWVCWHGPPGASMEVHKMKYAK